MQDMTQDFKEEIRGPDCKGKIYRCIINNHIDNSGSYVQKTSMKLLKRKSCSSCVKCDWFDEAIQEDVYNLGEVIIEDPIHNLLYEITAVENSVDWETGQPDGYELSFRRIKEKRVKT